MADSFQAQGAQVLLPSSAVPELASSSHWMLERGGHGRGLVKELCTGAQAEVRSTRLC